MIKAVFYFNDNSVTVHSENTRLVTEEFEPGYYITGIDSNGNLTIKKDSIKEVHDPYPNQKSNEIMDAIIKFLDSKNRKSCNEMGFMYKLNILLHGDQGVGKTSLLNYIANGMLSNHKAIVFRIDNPDNLEYTWRLAEEIRCIQDNPIVFVADEFEQYSGKGYEYQIKNKLDGNRSIDNSVFLAATNYLDRVPKTLKERPSRFRVVCKVDPITDKKIIRSLIEKIHAKCGQPFLTSEQIDSMVNSFESTTIDELKTIIIDALMRISVGLPLSEGVGFNKKEEKPEIDIDAYEGLISTFRSAHHVSSGHSIGYDTSVKISEPVANRADPNIYNNSSSEI